MGCQFASGLHFNHWKNSCGSPTVLQAKGRNMADLVEKIGPQAKMLVIAKVRTSRDIGRLRASVA